MADERRRHERKAVQDRAVIHRQAEALDVAHSTLYCTTVDISPAGLQLKLKQALDAGERIDIVIHVPGHKDSFHLRGEARWSTPSRDKNFYLGIQIDEGAGQSRDLSSWKKLFS